MAARALLALALTIGGAASGEEAAPLSAIDWLSDSVAMPAPHSTPGRAIPAEPPVSENALPEPVQSAPLGAPLPREVGARPVTLGLPDDLWTASRPEDLDDALARTSVPRLPVAQSLLRDLLVAAEDAPAGGDGTDVLLARVDALLGLGRLDDARSLLEQSRAETPQAFRRWFDIALLTGRENGACERLRALPQITPTYPVRVFCLARTDDWPAALVTLTAGERLGLLSSEEGERLVRFLDDLGGGPALPPPARPTPLDYLIYEAIGEPLRSTALPIAFAHAELRANTGWKSRIEGAERLSRAGAIAPDRLWEIYHERAPAASGGTWERVAAVRALDAAIEANSPRDVAAALPPAWAQLQSAGLGLALAERHGPALAKLQLGGDAGVIARQLGYLSGRIPDDVPDDEQFRAGLARGDLDGGGAGTPLEEMMSEALQAAPPARAADLLDEGRTGEALLLAIRQLDDGAGGSRDALADGLATLVAAGQGQRAARAALEYLILELHG